MNRFYIITNSKRKGGFPSVIDFNFSEIIYSVRRQELLVKILIGYDLYDKKRATFLLVALFFTWKMTYVPLYYLSSTSMSSVLVISFLLTK